MRNLLLSRVPQGSGPSEGRREKSWFTVDLVAATDGRTVHTRVSGGDPGYGETAKMLAESALCMAFDRLPKRPGVQTPAHVFGNALIKRLVAAGMQFRVLDSLGNSSRPSA